MNVCVSSGSKNLEKEKKKVGFSNVKVLATPPEVRFFKIKLA